MSLRDRTALPLRLALLSNVLALAGGAAPAADPVRKTVAVALQPPASHELGFVFDSFSPAIHQGDGDCPDGIGKTVRENYLTTLAQAERDRLMLKINEPELTTRWKAYGQGPNGTNVCANPELFDHPLQSSIKSKIARGLNLDGKTSGAATATTCAHEKFTGENGMRGVDNQVYRAMGCTSSYHGTKGAPGEIVRGVNGELSTGEHSMVMLVRGVDSVVNDPDVEIIFGSTDDRPVLDSKRGFISGASFTIMANPRFRNVLHGRIVNGVLISDPADIKLNRRVGHGGVRGQNSIYDFRMGRFRLAFQPDGSVKGLFGGYQPIRNVIENTILGGFGAVTVAGIDCASQLATLQKYADGVRNPATGKCTAASMAMDVSGVPAFVNDRTPAQMAAS